MRAPRLAVVALLALTAAACSSLGPGVSGLVDTAPPGGEHVRMVYLGTGGWIIERGEDLVLAAPLFTNPGLVRTGIWSIRSDDALVDRHMGRYDVSNARAILVGHGHYDHLMDVPRVASAHAPAARIVGSRTVRNTLGHWAGVGDRVAVVNDSAADARGGGSWLAFGAGVRVLALRSLHAPHFDGYTLYSGDRARPLTDPPRSADEWLDGETFAYLVDFLDPDGSIAFRVYYQDAVSPGSAGFVPQTLTDEHPVDAAIVVPATFDQVEWHPEALVENLRPRRVLLGHWEDFWTSVDEPARAMMLTDLEHFESRLERVFDGEWWRPDRWTEFRFPTR